MKIRWLIICIISFCILGCEATTPIEDNFGGVLVYGNPATPTIIHPFLTFDSISAYIVPLIFNGLIKINADGSLVPDLAESYEIKRNGLEYNIELKKGVKFHDGKELTSKDVKFTYEQIKEINKKRIACAFSHEFALVKSIELIDKYNIKIVLKQPFAPFLYALSVGILPKHIYQGKNNVNEEHRNDNVYWYPVGTGPFKLTYLDDKKIILNRFDNYFQGKPYLDKIICEVHPSSVIWAKLLKGEITYTRNVPLALLKEIKNVNFLTTYNMLEPAFYMLFLNCKKPFFRNKKIRQALNYAVDKESMINKILNGQGEICSSPILYNNWAYNNQLKPYRYNPQKALEMLTEVGWVPNQDDGFLYRNGELFKFNCLLLSGYPNILESAIFIQQQLNEIGIKMELKVLKTVNEFYRLKENDSWDSCFAGVESISEPDRNYSYFHSSRIGITNIVNHKNAEVDQLLELGRKTLDQEERKEIYYRFQKVLHNDPPGIFTFYKYTAIVIHKKFRNASPDDFEVFRGIENWWIDKNWKEHL